VIATPSTATTTPTTAIRRCHGVHFCSAECLRASSASFNAAAVVTAVFAAASA
jgi:hypothetical protein